MPDDPRPPVAIRITRPYQTEDEFLEREVETLTRTSVVLLGAQSRPQGVVLRFELTLASGHVLVRGEGRVVGFKPNAHEGLDGLTLRFTRLDTRSKVLIDKATALREQRRPSTRPPLGSATPKPPSGAPPTPEPAPPPPLPASSGVLPIPAPVESAASPGQRTIQPEQPPQPAPTPEPAPPPASVPGPPSSGQAPVGRDLLLERLRLRGKTLDAAAVHQILERRR